MGSTPRQKKGCARNGISERPTGIELSWINRAFNFTQEIEIGIDRSAPVNRRRRDHGPPETRK
jgi:hypothetical protein